MSTRWLVAALVPLALAAGVPAHAASAAAAGGQGQVLSGGVGSAERDRLAEQARGYELKLVFTTQKGAYLADVPVQISDAKGSVVVDAVSQGPWMFVDLPGGSYTVKATYEGKTESRKVSVGKSQKTVQFRWREPEALVASEAPRK